MRKRSSEEFLEAWKRSGIKGNRIDEWMISECSICETPIGYLVSSSGTVFWDGGCACAIGSRPEIRSWDDIAYHYNLQRSPEVIAEYDKFWGFDRMESMVPLKFESVNRMVLTVDAKTGQVELPEDITLDEAKYCIGVLAKHIQSLSDQMREYNELHLEQ